MSSLGVTFYNQTEVNHLFAQAQCPALELFAFTHREFTFLSTLYDHLPKTVQKVVNFLLGVDEKDFFLLQVPFEERITIRNRIWDEERLNILNFQNLLEKNVEKLANLAKSAIVPSKIEEATCPNMTFKVYPQATSSSHTFMNVLESSPKSDFLDKVNKNLQYAKLKLIEEGISASFLVYDEANQPLAIFKPSAFAGGSAINPKANTQLIGKFDIEQSSLLEVGAYHALNNFSGAPEVHLVEINLDGKNQLGSLQQFIKHDGTFADWLSDSFSKLAKAAGQNHLAKIMKKIEKKELSPHEVNYWAPKITELQMRAITDVELLYKIASDTLKETMQYLQSFKPDEIHQVGIFQMIIGNKDINAANFLLGKNEDNSINLIPIDFNLSFPKTPLEPMIMWSLTAWALSPYALEPLSKKTIDYFANYNIEEITSNLRAIGIEEARIFNFELRAHLIKKAVLEGFNLYQIMRLFVPAVIKEVKFGIFPIFEDLVAIDIFKKAFNELGKDYSTEKLLEIKNKAKSELNTLLSNLKNSSELFNKHLKENELKYRLSHPQTLREFSENIKEIYALTGLDKLLGDKIKYPTEEAMAKDEFKHGIRQKS